MASGVSATANAIARRRVATAWDPVLHGSSLLGWWWRRLTSGCRGNARDVSLAQERAVVQLVAGDEVEQGPHGHRSAGDIPDTSRELIRQPFDETDGR